MNWANVWPKHNWFFKRDIMNKALHSVCQGTQLSVFLDDKPGMLAGVAELLGAHGVNILALSLAEGIGHG